MAIAFCSEILSGDRTLDFIVLVNGDRVFSESGRGDRIFLWGVKQRSHLYCEEKRRSHSDFMVSVNSDRIF